METSIIKEILNNTTLLRFVKRFTANNLLSDNQKAEKFNVSIGKNSISILDNTATKLLITNADFKGEEYVSFNLKQLSDLIDVVGKEGKLIIPANSEMREMICKINNDICIVCPLPKTDKSKK